MAKSPLSRRMTARLLGAACAVAMLPLQAMAQDDRPVIGVSVADQRSLFYIAAVDGMRAAAEQAGYELNVESASNNSRQQIDQIDTLLVQQIGALIFISQDSTAAAAGVRAANEAGVPVVAVDQRPESGEGRLETFIATDSVGAARELCTWLFDQIGGEGKIAVLQGVLGSTAQQQRSQGCNEAIEATPGIEVVATQAANWDENEAYRATQNILTAQPGIKAVFEVVSSRDVALAHLDRVAPGITWGAIAAQGDDYLDAAVPMTDLLRQGDWDPIEGFVFLSSIRWNGALQDRLIATLTVRPRPVVIANPDLVAPREDGLSLEPGFWAHDLQDRTGIAPRFFGKPYPEAFAAGLDRLSCRRTAMIGDTLHTDILGGMAAGCETILVTRHGVLAGRDAASLARISGIVPDLILPFI